MYKIFSISSVALTAGALLALSGCARDTGDAGVKPIGVGFDPGELFQGPEPRGGIVDTALIQMRGTNLDLGVTGFFGSAGSFTDPESDPFDSVLAFSYLFSPAITAADEYQLVSPKGPDVTNACFAQVSNSGPLGSFRTVDIGDRMVIGNQAEDVLERSELTMARNPQDYPTNTTNVFIYYIGVDGYRPAGSVLQQRNWSFGEEVFLHFDGGLPPEGAPVASIPLPSNSMGDGDPWVQGPEELSGITFSNLNNGADALPARYSPTVAGMPSFLGGDGVLNVAWNPPSDAAPQDDIERASVVTIDIKLLRADAEGELLDDDQTCNAVETLAVTDTRDAAWQSAYEDMKTRWCDAPSRVSEPWTGFEPDVEIGNDEHGNNYYMIDGDDNPVADTCHDGLDNDDDGTCDEGGCEGDDGAWIGPDPHCARHTYKTRSCASDNRCYDIGGDRSGDGNVGDLICTAVDADGSFIVGAQELATLTSRVDMDEVVGVVVAVSRTAERLIEVPLVRNVIGNAEDNNPVRFRASQVVFARLEHE
jgi:hypothetical protein